MKMLAEYLEHAQHFERMAAQTWDPTLKEHFLTQAAAYRKLAEKRAAALGLRNTPAPDTPPPPE
jgi:hypothetical protein